MELYIPKQNTPKCIKDVSKSNIGLHQYDTEDVPHANAFLIVPTSSTTSTFVAQHVNSIIIFLDSLSLPVTHC